MTSIRSNSSKNSFTNKDIREVKSYCFLPQCKEKSSEHFDEESMPLCASKISTSTTEIYLKIKPVSEITKEENVYRILTSTILVTKFSSFDGNGRNSRYTKPSGVIVKRHAFTKIFGSETSQAEMFEQSIKHRVVDFLDGKSSTIMTYGTRDSGKTYTLFGTSASPGIIPRSIELVFSAINCTLMPWYKPTCRDTVVCLDETVRTLEARRKARVLNGRSMDVNQISAEARRSLENSQPENANPEECGESMYAVWLSFAEIYNGNIYDLLDDAEIHSPLRLTADNEGRACVCSLRRVYAITALEACQILMTGQSRMSTAATPSNPMNSRSHTIFTMKLLRYQKDRVADEVVLSTLTFCDLAGSTQFEMQQKRLNMREASNINNSLLVLCRCLKAVGQNQVAPFRESKLTRILQGALLGQENLSFIVNVDFAPNLYAETQNTFKFCILARKLVINSHREYKQLCEFEKSVHNSEACDSDVIASPSIHQTPSEITEISGYIDLAAYKNIQEQNKRLMKELEAIKSDILDREYAIRQELADHYLRMIEELEATYREHTKEIETEKHDLLKWSVKQVEDFYEERIDNLMRHKKRKRGGSGDYIEDNHALYEELEVENAQITSKVAILKETVKKLRQENKAIRCEKNKCSFELALVTEELKKFRQLARAGIRKWDGNSENTEDDADCLMNNLERLIDEKVKRAEMKLEEMNEYICAMKGGDTADASEAVKQELSKSEHSLSDTLMKIRKMEEELSQKEAYIVTLKHHAQMQERQLAEVQQCLNDARNENIKNQKCKCDQSTNISFDNYTVDSFSQENMPVSTVEKTVDTLDNWNIVSTVLATQTRTESLKKKSSNISDVDRRSFFENSSIMDYSISRSSDRSSKDDSGVSTTLQHGSRRSTSTSDSTHIHENENKCTQTCVFDEDSGIAIPSSSVEQLKMNCIDSKRQNREEMLHMADLSQDLKTIRDMIYALNEADFVNDREIIQHECELLHKKDALERLTEEEREIAIKCDNLFKMIEKKMQEYKCEIYELTCKLKVKNENEDRTSKNLDKYIERSKSLESKLSLTRNQLDEMSNKCANEHLPQIENLEDEVLEKTLHINELNGKIAEMQHKFEEGNELFEKISDFEIVVNKWQRDKNVLSKQLYECVETRLTLENKLKKLEMKIAERDSEITSLKSKVCNIKDLNITNDEKVRNLYKRVTENDESISSIKTNLQCCEDLRKNTENAMKAEIDNFRSQFLSYKNNTAFLRKIYDDSQDEITHLTMQLQHKELEITLLKNNRNATIQKYEILMRHFQNKIKEKDEQFTTIEDGTNNSERYLNENNALCDAFDFLKEAKSINDDKEKQPEEFLKNYDAECKLTSNIDLESKHSSEIDVSSTSSEDSVLSGR
ncbi:kinesin-like protein KIF20A [Linepithema humile]|uniref:kinesin-like protein KIF20A n=1 Tax=Linepithema humile TaxID=83485 RepID=UPI00351E3247